MNSNSHKPKGNERKEFAKINEIRYKKLLGQIEKYKQTNSSVKNEKIDFFNEF